MTKKSSAHTLEYILLGLIREQPAHGYALFDRLRKTPELSLIWQVKRSKLYYLLDKLESENFLTSSIRSEGHYPDRNVYQITPAGVEVLDDWLQSPVLSSRYVRLAFLSKLYFLLRESKSEATELVNTQIEICQGWIDSLIQEYQDRQEEGFISNQVLLFRIGQISAMMEWLKSCRDTMPE